LRIESQARDLPCARSGYWLPPPVNGERVRVASPRRLRAQKRVTARLVTKFEYTLAHPAFLRP
jgi:hypothetical protein